MEHFCIDGTMAHHWIIEPSGKASSMGKCKRCGQERRFRNSIPVVINGWNQQTGTNQRDKGKDNGTSN